MIQRWFKGLFEQDVEPFLCYHRDQGNKSIFYLYLCVDVMLTTQICRSQLSYMGYQQFYTTNRNVSAHFYSTTYFKTKKGFWRYWSNG